MYEGITVYEYREDELYLLNQKERNGYLKALLDDWTETPKGKWCIKYAVDFRTLKAADPNTCGYKICVRAMFKEKDATLYRLKWANE
jgi:hypothetical protein